MTIMEEFRSRNFSIYGQWTGVICIIVCFAVGLSSIITFIFNFNLAFIFGICSIVFSFIILFIEIPLLLRICPTSEKFDTFIRRFETNYMRAAIYLGMSVIIFCSLIFAISALLAPAILLLLAALFYALAGLKGQGFVGSKTLGGHGVAQMIV